MSDNPVAAFENADGRFATSLTNGGSESGTNDEEAIGSMSVQDGRCSSNVPHEHATDVARAERI